MIKSKTSETEKEMSAKWFFLTLIFSPIFCYGQQSSTVIKKVEVYALRFMSTSLIAIGKNDIKEMSPLYVRVVDTDEIANANISELVANLEKRDNDQLPDDYRALFILHDANSKKYTYYIASGSGGIVSKNNLYKVSYPLIAAIYSFFPDDYFTSFYTNHSEVFD